MSRAQDKVILGFKGHIRFEDIYLDKQFRPYQIPMEAGYTYFVVSGTMPAETLELDWELRNKMVAEIIMHSDYKVEFVYEGQDPFKVFINCCLQYDGPGVFEIKLCRIPHSGITKLTGKQVRLEGTMIEDVDIVLPRMRSLIFSAKERRGVEELWIIQTDFWQAMRRSVAYYKSQGCEEFFLYSITSRLLANSGAERELSKERRWIMKAHQAFVDLRTQPEYTYQEDLGILLGNKIKEALGNEESEGRYIIWQGIVDELKKLVGNTNAKNSLVWVNQEPTGFYWHELYKLMENDVMKEKLSLLSFVGNRFFAYFTKH